MQTAIHTASDTFDDLSRAVQARLQQVVGAHGPHLFLTDAGDILNSLYLGGFDTAEERQHHNCTCCRHFLERFGSLVAITDDGRTVPALWDPETAPARYRDSVAALARAVARAPVTGVFLTEEVVLGSPEAGGYTHFAVDAPPTSRRRRDWYALTAGQAMAARREDFRTLRHALGEFPREHVAQAVTLLETDALFRAEKVAGPARFLLELQDALATLAGSGNHRRRDALVWRAVAGAPAGFCTPRSSMVGTLLEDIAAGMAYEAVRARFAAKMHPLQYQRPQAAPSAGTIAQAEKLFEQMGLAPALERRFARIEDCELLWTPPREAPSAEAGKQAAPGLFSHLAPKGTPVTAPPMRTPVQDITWEKFARTVLPAARRIEVLVEGRMNLCTLVTAVHADAPPVLQWDREDRRNPVSWYVYQGGASATHYGLAEGSWVPVTGVTLQPSMWGPNPLPHMGASAILLLEGARDARDGGLGLFPETMRSELHGVRSVIEAHSRSRQPEERDEASACGLRVGDEGGFFRHVIRVATATGTASYRVDRWD